MKQTAVEWLEQKLIEAGLPLEKGEAIEIEQAKEMEKQQIIDAVSKGWDNYEEGKVRWIGEQYYKETFKNK